MVLVAEQGNRRAERLLKIFRDVTKGGKAIVKPADARLFLEAVRSHPTPASSMDAVTASEAGLTALRISIRIESSLLFIQEQVIPFIEYLISPELKMVYNGDLLRSIILIIVNPPTLWNNLLNAFTESRLSSEELYVFSWLCYELICLPGNDHAAIVNDVSKALNEKPFSDTQDQRTREITYRIKKMLALKQCNASLEEMHGAGGRHDNDFADFREVSIYPTSDEFYSSTTPFYRTAGQIEDIEPTKRAAAHLDNQFRLLREDMLGELREDLQIALGKKRGRKQAHILGDLSFAGIDTGDEKRGRYCAVLLDCAAGLEPLRNKSPEKRKEFLEQNRSFLRHQSFGAFCGANSIVGFAFLVRDVDRLSQQNPVVALQFTDSDALARALLALRSPQGLRFVLVDTPVFAYQPVLECLQELVEMPLDGYLTRTVSEPDDAVSKPLEQSASVMDLAEGLKTNLEDNGAKIIVGSKKFNLEKSQALSVLHALQSRVALIQGPPGTGKSFVGALIAKILLQKPAKRILILSYTNHALDQFLEDLMQIGISSDFMTRLGSKSTEATQMLSLEQQIRGKAAQRSSDTWLKINGIKEEMTHLREEVEQASGRLTRAKLSSFDILESLEFSDDYQDYYEAFRLPEQEEGFQVAGRNNSKMAPEDLYDRWSNGGGPGQLSAFVSPEHHHIWAMAKDRRLELVRAWTDALRTEIIEHVQSLAQRFDEAQRQMNTLFGEARREFIKTKKVVACTTTAAAKYKSLIKASDPDVVLVEEAGEILEAHVLTALHASTSQLVLIGDHQQLRPKINNYGLSVEKGEGFDLNRSLFERLLLQDHEHVTLRKQHRMHPEISALVRHMTYPDLLDHSKTLTWPEPKGLTGRVVFVNHSHAEAQVGEVADKRDIGFTGSKQNQFEAQMVLILVRYLSQQGYKASRLVVLTPYLGQLRLLRDLLSAETDPILNDLDSSELIRAGLLTAAAGKVDSKSSQLRLSTIDNYQGEESDVVIASLTRSNKRGDIGFMKAPERLNVLCSRAKQCLLMIGDMETFMASTAGSSVWHPFFAFLKLKEFLHDGIPVRCQQHPETEYVLRSPADFKEKCPDGGCDRKCDSPLSCGKHSCQRRCHRIADHSKTPCDERIDKVCERNHKYRVSCGKQDDACPACRREDDEIRRRLERDLKMEKNRADAQKKYAQERQLIQDEIDHERRLMRYAQQAEEEKKELEKGRADLQALRETKIRAKQMDEENKRLASRKAAGKAAAPQEPQWTDPPGCARDEWQKMKAMSQEASAPLDTLMDMIGLESIKQEFLAIKSKVDVTVAQQVSLAKERFGCTLLGNPGTGKTTVARIYSKFLTSVGVIAGQHFEETSGSKLANMGVQGCQKMLDGIQEKGGGVIFIDEAYQLSSGNSPGGRAVLDFLLAEVENLTGKVVFILAGYNKQMESFFAHNPGFPSRFPIEMKFDDYTDDELLRIMKYQLHSKYGGRIKWEDELYLRISCRRLGRGRGKEGFGNARAVENTLATIAGRQANRLRRLRGSGTQADNLLFTKEDIIGPEPSNALVKCASWKNLQKLIGLSSVKQSVQALVDTIQTNYQRELDEEAIIEYTLNKVFLGSPGTGKTTVAKLYAQILVDLGLLSNGEVILKNPADFVGAVIGASEAQTKAILASTVGKVLVIDEAYGLYGGNQNANQFKTAVIDTIVAEVQSVPGDDRCVLLLGYKDQMEEMFQNVNPGLQRRFPISSAFMFEDFNQPELRQILDLKLKQQAFGATDQAKNVAMEMLDRARNRPHFGNAGEIDIILDSAKARHQKRLSAKETSQRSTLEALDFDEDFDRAERSDTNVAKLFEGTVGCEMIVAKLEGFQHNVRTMKKLGMDPKEAIPFNFLFRGPPGTGKTSTARKMGKVFYDMGFLATAEVVDCSATDMIGQYVGQTGPKVIKLLDKALGRVLFVDEAYRLAEGHFAQEAVDELVDCVTKDRYKGRLIIILAGYDNDINRLLSVNPGMSSRFPEVIDFHPLNPDACLTLLVNLLTKQKRKLEAQKSTNSVNIDALTSASSNFRNLILGKLLQMSKLSGWANARDVEGLAKSMFGAGLRAISGSHMTITSTIIESELEKLLKERISRSQQAAFAPRRAPRGNRDAPQAQPPAPPQQETRQETSISTETREDSDPEPPEDKGVGDQKQSKVQRDAGVSDEVWEQLERDKKAREEEEAKYQALLKKKKEACGAARDRILKELLEEEEKREQEKKMREKAAMIGRCPVGYEWIRQADGFRCAGGSHFLSNDAVLSA